MKSSQSYLLNSYQGVSQELTKKLSTFKTSTDQNKPPMRNQLLLSLLLCFTMGSFSSCAPKEKSNNSKVDTKVENISTAPVIPGFTHAVYFWLKKDNPELLDEFIKQGLPKLAKVPSIQSVSWGPPAGTPREVVDNSYDLAWIVNFANAEDQDKYQVDPLHVDFVEKYKSLFEKVQVYDNIVQHYQAN